LIYVCECNLDFVKKAICVLSHKHSYSQPVSNPGPLNENCAFQQQGDELC